MAAEGLKCFASDLYASLSSDGQDEKPCSRKHVTLDDEILEEHIKDLDCSRNLFFSPISVYSAFAILLPGTAGETAMEIKKALHATHEEDETKFHKAIAQALHNLTASTPETSVCMANKIFLDKRFSIKSAYSSLVSECYSVTQELLPFSDPERSRADINQWVKENTKQKIGELFPKGSIQKEQVGQNGTKMVIANAVYFKGAWESAFKKSNTRDDKFILPDGKTKDIKLMYKNIGNAMYCEFADMNAKAVCLSFKDSRLRMFILLPNQEDGLPQLLKKLFTVGPTQNGCGDQRYLEMFLSSMYYRTREVNLYIPRFKIGEGEPSMDLSLDIRKLGVSKIFDYTVADFSSLTYISDLCVSSIFHCAVLEVNEEGAEAAAATGIALRVMSCSRPILPPPVEFKVTHPFVIAIADNAGTPLFLGHVFDPK